MNYPSEDDCPRPFPGEMPADSGGPAVRRKLAGVLVGAVLGAPAGALLVLLEPWAGVVYFVKVGALLGAIVGAVAAGKRVGQIGWSVLLGSLFGAFLVGVNSFAVQFYFRGVLFGACLGLVCGVISEVLEPGPS